VIGLLLQIEDRAFKHHGAPVQSLHHRLHMGLLLVRTHDAAKLVHVDKRQLERRDESDDETLDGLVPKSHISAAATCAALLNLR
jgi:hypothetical protein